MSFNATLYKINSDPQVLMKIPTGAPPPNIPVNSIRPTTNVDIINPTFELDYNSEYTKYNYIYVGSPFNRYYFIEDFKIDIGKKIIISCSVDVLQTYIEPIRQCSAQIIRTSKYSKTADYLTDNVFPVSSWTQVQNYEFSDNPFSTIDSLNGRYVLTVIGGAVSQITPPDPEEGDS